MTDLQQYKNESKMQKKTSPESQQSTTSY